MRDAPREGPRAGPIRTYFITFTGPALGISGNPRRRTIQENGFNPPFPSPNPRVNPLTPPECLPPARRFRPAPHRFRPFADTRPQPPLCRSRGPHPLSCPGITPSRPPPAPPSGPCPASPQSRPAGRTRTRAAAMSAPAAPPGAASSRRCARVIAEGGIAKQFPCVRPVAGPARTR
jgi:hypothetical protein